MSETQGTILLMFMALCALGAAVTAVRAMYVVGAQNMIIDVFSKHTAVPFSAEELSNEANVSLKRTRKVLAELERYGRVRHVQIEGERRYLSS